MAPSEDITLRHITVLRSVSVLIFALAALLRLIVFNFNIVVLCGLIGYLPSHILSSSYCGPLLSLAILPGNLFLPITFFPLICSLVCYMFLWSSSQI